MTSENITRYEGEFISTWYQGCATVSYAKLVETFGEPHETGDLDKTDAEWCFDTPAGIATIYNYKDGPAYLGAAGTPVEDITDWHIGGTTREVVPVILKALGLPA